MAYMYPLVMVVPVTYTYSTYFKPMGHLPYISSEQGVGIYVLSLYTNIPYISVLYLYKNFELKRGVGL